MNVHEWPLTAFTILAQMAVGTFVALGVVTVSSSLKRRRADAVAIPALYALGPLMVAALIASMLHLGTPTHAPNAIRHIATSWLAREIVFGAGFAALGFAFAALTWLDWCGEKVRTALAAFTAVWGLVFIWVMANVYYGLETVPAWNRWTTPAQFYGSTLLLGALTLAVAFVWYPVFSRVRTIDRVCTGRRSEAVNDAETRKVLEDSLVGIGLVSLVALLIQVVVAQFATFPSGSPNPAEYESSPALFALRLVLAIVGAGALGLLLAVARERGREVDSARIRLIVTLCWLIVLVSEVLDRFMFYGQMDRIGI